MSVTRDGGQLPWCGTCGSETDADCAATDCPESYPPSALNCADCGEAYGSPTWIDVTLPDHQWAMIQPREGGGGVLCAGCIGHRAKMLPGAEAIRAEIAFAHAHAPQYRAIQSGNGWLLQRAVRVQADGENGGIDWRDMGPVNVEAVAQERYDRLRMIAEKLWGIIDDIDTADDRVKGDDASYRKIVNRLQAKRFDYARSFDGQTLVFTTLDAEVK